MKCQFKRLRKIKNKYNKVLTKTFLKEKYDLQLLSQNRIADLVKCSQTLISLYLKKYKIKTRTHSERNRGKNNPMFGRKHKKESKRKSSIRKGGTGIPYELFKYPVEFFKIRNKILKRDNYICQLCSEYGNEVHHIDYDKKNNEEENLCCLCHKCNMKVNKNRKYWKKYFKNIIKEIYAT